MLLRGWLKNTGERASTARDRELRRYFYRSFCLFPGSCGHGHEGVARGGGGGYVFYFHESSLGLTLFHLAFCGLTSILPWNFLNNSQIILHFSSHRLLYRRLTTIITRLLLLLMLCLLLPSLNVLFELCTVSLQVGYLFDFLLL